MNRAQSPAPTNLHEGSKSDIPDLDQMIEANPCSKVYLALEDCLVETDRSWQKCQQQVSFFFH
jgi:hypothetical protein